MEKRLEATLAAVKTVQPVLAKFYNSLCDEQKARFNSLRSAPRPTGGRRWHRGGGAGGGGGGGRCTAAGPRENARGGESFGGRLSPTRERPGVGRTRGSASEPHPR